MLHEVAASDLDITNIVNPVRKLVSNIDFFDGDVDRVDLEAGPWRSGTATGARATCPTTTWCWRRAR